VSSATEGRATAGAGRRWIAVRRASEIAGVNESTVRRWVDAGKIRSFRTPGQHRRIAEQDLRALIEADPERRSMPDDERAIDEIRRWVAPARARGGWFSSLAPEQRQQYRSLGRRLVALARDYVSGRERRDDIEHTVDEMSRRYGRLLQQHGAGLADAIETYMLFRDATLEAAQEVVGRHLLDPEQLASTREQIALLLDRVLIQIAGAFATSADPGAPRAAGRLSAVRG
jgi:excisionase family DNA binding protein